MTAFQRLLFETKHIEGPVDPAVRARIWADRSGKSSPRWRLPRRRCHAAWSSKFALERNDRHRGDAEFVVQGGADQAPYSAKRRQPRLSEFQYRQHDSDQQAVRPRGRSAARRGAARGLEAGIEALAPADGRCISFKVRAENFAQWGLTPADLACRRLDCSGADYRLLTGYARMLVDIVDQLTAEQAQAAAQHLTDLTGHWRGAQGPRPERQCVDR